MRRTFLRAATIAIVASLLTGGASLPAMATDVLIHQDGSDGANPGGDGGDGGDGPNGADDQTTDRYYYVGEDGKPGVPGDNGGNGDGGQAGGTVKHTTAGAADSLTITANGGDGKSGGDGGDGGDGGKGGDASTPAFGADGGDGGAGGAGGKGGNGGAGGAGGTISLKIDDAITGDVSLSATGGYGATGGAGGNGGDGGDGGSGYALRGLETGGDGGKGGDGVEGGDAGTGGEAYYYTLGHGQDGAPGQSLPAAFDGANGADGAGGNIKVTLNASVGGNLSADAGTGSIDITLRTNSSVGGTISANAAANSVLRFALTVASQAEYDAARAYLADHGNAMSGSVTILGKTYNWTGFDQLVEALTLAGVRASVSESTAPVYLSCSPRAVRAYYDAGAIQLIARRTEAQPSFRIGRIQGEIFSSQNNTGWSVNFGAKGRFDVVDASGATVATCKR